MSLKVNFMYRNEIFTFLNKTFTKCAIGFYIFLFFIGVLVSDFKTTMPILGLITIVYFGFWIRTIKIKKKYKYYAENGIKCNGIIKDIKKVREYSSGDRFYTVIYLIVEYKNPYTNKMENITTESVNGNPFIYLSSLDVTVYALKDGKTLVTDFKRINKLTDSVKYKTDEKFQKEVELEDKNSFKIILFSIIFLFIVVCIFTNIKYILPIILVICIILILFRNKK